MCQNLLASIPKQAIDASEAEGMTYLREEEKLARDVYVRLRSQWTMPVFANISQAEQRHFDVLKQLLDRYQLPDPALNRAEGVFQNGELQTLYAGLVTQGEASLSGAFRAGATIEDLISRDLEMALSKTDNNDLKTIYLNLQNASRNHLRTFVGRLEALGESYAARYISEETLADILARPVGAGMGYAGRGNGRRGMGRGNGLCPLGMTP